MKTSAGIRCDACTKVEPRTLTNDHRPIPGSRERWFDFVIPPSVSQITGKPDGRFRGIASESNPKQLAALHACPTCAPKIRKFIKHKDPEILPHGPLRQIMQEIKTRDVMRDIGVA